VSDDDLALLEQAPATRHPKGSRETWSAEIVDVAEFVEWTNTQFDARHYFRNNKIHMPAINAIARQQKSLMKIPGVRAVSKRSS